MLRQFFEYARYLKPVMKLFIAALAAGALAAAASGFGFPLMIAKVFPVVFDNTQIPPELQNIIAHLVAPEHMHTAVLVAVCSLLPLLRILHACPSVFWGRHEWEMRMDVLILAELARLGSCFASGGLLE